jgi:hypothetical protein
MESSAFPENLSGKLRCSPHIQALSWRRVLALSGNVAGCMALTRATPATPTILRQRFSKSWSISAAWSRARTPLPNGNDQAAIAAIDCGGHQASSRPAWHHPPGPASPGSGMPAGPQAWRHWRRGTPQNGKHSCAKLHRHWLGRSSRQTASSPVTHVRRERPVSYRADRASGRRKLMTPAAGNPDGIESLGEKNDETAEHVVRSDGTAHRGAGQLG